jgi:hypothetical protein
MDNFSYDFQPESVESSENGTGKSTFELIDGSLPLDGGKVW